MKLGLECFTLYPSDVKIIMLFASLLHFFLALPRIYLCASVDPSLLRIIASKNPSNDAISELCSGVLFLIAESSPIDSALDALHSIVARPSFNAATLRNVFGVLWTLALKAGTLCKVIAFSILLTFLYACAWLLIVAKSMTPQSWLDVINLAHIALSSYPKDYEMCYNTLGAVLEIITKYHSLPTVELVSAAVKVVLENIVYPDICDIGCKFFKLTISMVPLEVKQSVVLVVASVLRTHLGVPCVVESACKILMAAIKGDFICQAFACKACIPQALVLVIRHYASEPSVLGLGCSALSMLLALPILHAKYCTPVILAVLQNMNEASSPVSVLIKSLQREENPCVLNAVKKGLCTNMSLRKGEWIQQVLYKCLTCKKHVIVCESCLRANHMGHDYVEFFCVGRCSKVVAQKKE